MSALEELERYAVKHASEAVRMDSQGARGMAASEYQHAVEILLKLCSLYPNVPQNRIYMSRIEAYRKRIKELQKEGGQEEKAAEATAATGRVDCKLKEKPRVKWEDIANLENAKRAILEAVVYPVKRPDLFPLGWPKGILLFGPPGCGKTLIAAATANEIDANFYCVDAAAIMSKWLGESERNVAKIFEEARSSSAKGKPSIIFVDEIDSLMAYRSEEVGGEARARNQFLKEMDGILDKNRNLYVYVFGATNKPWALDEPFVRRFQKRIFVPLPDHHARLEMIKIYARELNLAPEVDVEDLAKRMDGFSGSDIRDLLQSAQIKVVREFFENNGSASNPQAKPRAITWHDLQEVLSERKTSVSQNLLKAYREWDSAFKAL
ncbi:AAA family ATPase [Candidatus Hecatella orcuttiae]|jgi:SpoVK/Ycf46/Vps4 family AAA+-type ATPase|uniref:AAA family ATPase n=1 Tax=Candidatus Hecatella orcuttiae TaxID=1935119 RepID=UPI002867C917|nr:AAA family ATPase [Candidatus Hecatella orcuttiae]